MENDHLPLIWKFLDGNCSIEEQAKVEFLNNTDPDFTLQMERACLIHNALDATSVIPVPHDLSQQVLARLSDSARRQDYKGISMIPLMIFLSAMIVFVFVSVQFINPEASQFNFILEEYILNYLPEFSIRIPSFGSQSIYVAISLIALPLLYFTDQLLYKRRITRMGMLMLT